MFKYVRFWWRFFSPGIFGIDDLIIGAIVGGAFSAVNADNTNKSNQEINATQMGFNAEEAQKSRDFNAEQAGVSRDFNSAQATIQRDWETQMSNTSWQRGVKDMEAAGINPILAASRGGGASTPSGVAASSTPSQGPAASVGGLIPQQNAVMAGIQSAATLAGINNTVADTKLKEAQANREGASASNIVAQTTNLMQQTELIQKQIMNTAAQTDNEVKRGHLLDAQTDLTRVQQLLEDGRISFVEAQTRVQNTLARLNQQNVNINLPAEQFGTSELGKASPLMDFVRRGVGVIGSLRGGK